MDPSLCRWARMAAGRRSSRDKEVSTTEQRIEEEKVKACNLVMDEKTGLRSDGNTCWNCWRAVYHEDGCRGTCHAVVGPDEKPCSTCERTNRGSPYSSAVSWAIHKLNYLEKSRAAGNR